jgi:hypothetical protein
MILEHVEKTLYDSVSVTNPPGNIDVVDDLGDVEFTELLLNPDQRVEPHGLHQDFAARLDAIATHLTELAEQLRAYQRADAIRLIKQVPIEIVPKSEGKP